VLTDDEWRLLDDLRAGARDGLDDPATRRTLAGAAEKLRVAAVPGGSATGGGFEVPRRDPCPYCENYAGRYAPHGPPAIVVEDDLTVVFLAPAPMGGMPGHTLVTSRRHAETLFDLRPEEEAALGAAIAATARAIRSALDPAGLLVQQNNGVAAFQTVAHVHFHVVPKVPGPYPGPEPAQIVPHEERARTARLLREHWPT